MREPNGPFKSGDLRGGRRAARPRTVEFHTFAQGAAHEIETSFDVGAFLRGTLYSAVFAMTQQATAGSFFLDGSTLPPDTDPRNDLVNGNPKVVGDFDWFTDAPDTTQRPNQPTANNTTPVDSNFRVVQGDPAVPNVIGQYAPLGAGNKGLYMASRGSSTNNGTNSQRQEVEYQLGAGDNAQTLGARFQVLRVNNASVPTDGYAFHPGLGLLELGASGTSAFAALTVNDDGSDHYRYDVVQVRPFASGGTVGDEYLAAQFVSRSRQYEPDLGRMDGRLDLHGQHRQCRSGTEG